MTQQIELFYDFRSPYSYLAFTQLRQMDVVIRLRPMKILKVMEKVGNVPTTITCAAKGVEYSFLFMRAEGGQLAEIAKLVDAGTIRPVIDEVFAFDESTGGDQARGVRACARQGSRPLNGGHRVAEPEHLAHDCSDAGSGRKQIGRGLSPGRRPPGAAGEPGGHRRARSRVPAPRRSGGCGGAAGLVQMSDPDRQPGQSGPAPAAAISASYTPRGAVPVPTASVPNSVVRSLLTSPERSTFKPAAQLASHNPLIWQASHNRTKMAVVRLHQRKRPERDGKRPQMGFGAGARSSDRRAETPAFCAVSAARPER